MLHYDNIFEKIPKKKFHQKKFSKKKFSPKKIFTKKIFKKKILSYWFKKYIVLKNFISGCSIRLTL